MREPFVLGLTGSIGMGKSTTADLFRRKGIPVWDADETVHRLYAPGGKAVRPLSRLRPDVLRDNAIDRSELKKWIASDPTALKQIESIVHPLVASDREDFLLGAEAVGEPIVVVDIPLLFETGYDDKVDAVLVVTAPEAVQRARVMARPGMTEEAFQTMLSKQMPDAEKRERADFVIQSLDIDATRKSVAALIERLQKRMTNA